MISALFGLASALGLGVADFMARFSARALGAPLAYACVLLVGAIATTGWIVGADIRLVWSPYGCAMAVAHGVSVAMMCILLYLGLARGPIAVVAPIVAAHPAFVLVVNVAMGVRPSPLQWAAMVSIIVGGIAIARNAVSDGDEVRVRADRVTVLIAFGACMAYVALVLTAQIAAPLLGEVQTVWIGRWSGLAFVAAILLVQGRPLRFPAKWVPFVGFQGGLDTLGYAAFLAGAATAAPHITMVVASAFSVVTVILARLILHEPVSRLQWGCIGLIAVGTSILSMP
jgi:drug/metabolite transporter (DMT)-like permease